MDSSLSIRERLFVALQHVLPKQTLTRLMGRLAASESGNTTHAVIRWFIRRYQVNMAEAADPRVESYASFNAFFTRALKDDARPAARATHLCPVDGAISQFGRIENGRLFQAKGHDFSALTLVGGDAALAARFAGGSFATIYLSPRDYHRIHMPCDGELREMIYIPGDLYSVNPTTARAIPGLFARNERVVCVFDTPHGPFVQTLVGATIVGSMATVWHGLVNPPRPGEIRRWTYRPGEVRLKQSDEMGRFLLGSTVVMLFPQASLKFSEHWAPGAPVRMNEAMAEL